MNFKSITPLQWLGILLVINGALVGSTAQLTDLFGPGVVKVIVAICSIGNSIAGGLVTFMSGQGSLVKTVAAMPGVEAITVNRQASTALAQIAVSGAADSEKIEATPDARQAVVATARAG